MVVHIYGPVDGRRNDAFMLAESGLLPQLVLLTIGGISYLVYGDSAYPVTRNMTVPFCSTVATPGSIEARINEEMAVARTCTSEWWYGICTNTFQTLDFARWQRQWLTAPALQYFVATLLVNCRSNINS